MGAAWQRRTLPQIDGSGRSLALRSVLAGLRRSTQRDTVRERLELTFRRYGLPEAFFVDNGTPWGDTSGERWTRLFDMAAQARHRGHPQSSIPPAEPRQKRTLPPHAECRGVRAAPLSAILSRRSMTSMPGVKSTISSGHMRRSASRCRQVATNRLSEEMHERLPAPEYDSHEIVRTVSITKAYISFKGWPLESAAGIPRRAPSPSGRDQAMTNSACSSPPIKWRSST